MRVTRATILLLSFSALSVGLTACEDEASNKRRELQETVAAATQDLREATLVVVDPNNAEQFQSARNQLTKVVSDLRSADTTGNTGQEIAIHTLLADAGQKLASMYLAELEQAQAAMRNDSALARAHVSSILQLDEFVQATSAIDVTDETEALNSARSGATTQLGQLSDMLAQLDGPIGQLTSANRADLDRINMLRRDAEELVQMAGELGPADGFPQYEQALQMQREAGAIETQISHREVDLAYQYEPQQETADSQAQQLQRYIDALDQAKQKLGEIVDTVSNEVSKTNQQMSALQNELDNRLAAIASAVSGPIETAHQEGIQAAEQALSGARSAARDSKSNSGKLLEAQLFETQGRLHWSKARALAAQISVLERVIAAGNVIRSASNAQRALNDATSSYEAAITSAKDSYTAAQTALPGGNIEGMDALRRSLDLAIGTISGQSMQDMQQQTPTLTNPGAPIAGDGSTDGFASPEAALTAFKTIDPMKPESSMIVINAIHTTTPLQVQFVDAAAEANQRSTELHYAIEQTLGQNALDALAQMGAAATPDYSTATILQQDAETATIEADMLQPGMSERFTIGLKRVENVWLVTFESFQQEFSMPGMSISDSIKMMQAMSSALQDLTTQVTSGKITNQEEFMMAIQTAMMNAMSGQ